MCSLWRRWLCGLLVVCLSVSVSAQTQNPPAKEYRYTYGSKWTDWGGPAARCQDVLAFITVSTPDGESKGYEVREVFHCWIYVQTPYGKSWEEASYQARDKPNPDEVCKAKQGVMGVVNWTEGFTRTPDEGDRAAVGGYNAPPANGQMCQQGCEVSAQIQGPGVQYYVSQQPTAQGLYRRSADFPSIGMGTACTASNDAPNSPVAPEPKCTGTLGQVNNKTVCVSTPAAPVATQGMPEPPSKAIAGNPSAGPKPTSGSGSGTGSVGRTPDAGTGGNSGGSMAAAVGGKGGDAGGTATGTGTVKAPATGEQQANCGAPGQPVCAVKVNEEGYPDGKSAFTTSKDAIDKNATDTKTAINGAGTMQAPQWSFSFQLPTGCTPYDTGLRGFVLDPCKYQSMIHDLMSMLWAAATVFCIIGMVGRTIREA